MVAILLIIHPVLAEIKNIGPQVTQTGKHTYTYKTLLLHPFHSHGPKPSTPEFCRAF